MRSWGPAAPRLASETSILSWLEASAAEEAEEGQHHDDDENDPEDAHAYLSFIADVDAITVVSVERLRDRCPPSVIDLEITVETNHESSY